MCRVCHAKCQAGWFTSWKSRLLGEITTASDVQFSSVAQSCLALCDPMDHSTPGLPVHHQLPEFTQTHVHPTWWCHPTISSSVVPFSFRPQSFPASGSFQMSQFLTLGGQSFGVSASASVLPMNTQDWSPLGWTGWISLQSKELSRVFSNITVQMHQIFSRRRETCSRSERCKQWWWGPNPALSSQEAHAPDFCVESPPSQEWRANVLT